MNLRTILVVFTLSGMAVSASSDNYEQADIYRDLRSQALGRDVETLKPRNGVFAVLMETGYDDAVVTVVATADGSASMYFSNGGGLIGAGEYDQVREVVFESLSESEKYANNLDATESYPLPGLGQTRFYVVTERGTLTAEAPTDLLGNEKHELSPLFHQIHKLIAYMREADEHRRSQRSE